MKEIQPTKLVVSAHKPMTLIQFRPVGCYCDEVKRRCGVCNRDPRVKELMKLEAVK